MGEKSMGENCVKSMGVKRWVKNVWLNLVKSMDENFAKSMDENFAKSMGVKDGCKKYG